jgi:predicted enzyme related to lactoylglutathione lyase
VITGVHIEIVNDDVEEAYAFLRDKLGLPGFDAGGGYLIFEPGEVEVSVVTEAPPPYQLSFICDNLDATMSELESRGVACTRPVREESWGRVTEFSLPNGRSVQVYQRKYSKERPLGPH